MKLLNTIKTWLVTYLKRPLESVSVGELVFVLLILMALCGSCGILPGSGSALPAVPVPKQDLAATAVSALPEVADAFSNLLQTFVITAVIVALMFPAARLAAVGVFVAFYDRIAQIFKPRDKGSNDRNGQT